MIWSFFKITLFVAAVAALTLGAGYLTESGDGIRIAVANMEYTLGPVQAVITVLVLLVAFWLVIRLGALILAFGRFLNGDETAISRYFDRNRERKGFQALADGMMALASGEGRAALSHSARAEKYLHRPELTNLLTAQAAELAGDTRRSGEVYKQLLADNRTRFVGVRGLMKLKMAEGDTATAMKLAEKAFLMKPKHEEVQDALLQLQAASGDWTGARKVLNAKLKQGLLPRDVHRRRDAVLALQEARSVVEEGATVEAREAAIAANKLSPDLVPAAVMAARAYIGEGKPKLALRVLKKAWEAQPHPDLAAAFAAINPDETPVERLKRFETLLQANPSHEESRLLRAELNIAAEDFPAARRAMGDLAESHPTARTLTMMAAIERGEGGDDALVRGYLTRALSAGRGAQWLCDKCQSVHADWVPVCENCGGFDTLSWREAAQGSARLPNGAEMLPLIVGTAASAAQPVVEVPPAPRPEPMGPAGAIYDAEFIDEKEAAKAAN